MIGLSDIRCVETEVPRVEAGQVLVKTHMAAICGSDLHVVCYGAGLRYNLPCKHGYPGHEGVGEVVESRCASVAVGTRVLCFPSAKTSEGFSEYQRLEGKYVLPLPQGMPERQLLMAQQLGTVIFAARQTPVDLAGKTALVLGQGSAGLFWTYWLKRRGASRVIVSDRSDARLALSAAYGADVTVNVDRTKLAEVIGDLTSVGPDYVVEAVGKRETLQQSIELCKPDGALTWFGLPDTDKRVPISFAKFFRKRLTASSTHGAQDELDAASFKTALRLIAEGHIDVSSLVSHVYSIEDVQKAFDVAHEPCGHDALKVTLTF